MATFEGEAGFHSVTLQRGVRFGLATFQRRVLFLSAIFWMPSAIE
jgi:hypothetical protein